MTRPVAEIHFNAAEVIATIGTLPAIAPAVIAERNKDAVDHHQRGVLKDAKSNFPGGRGAQKFLAARMGRYGRTTGSSLPTKMSQARGESFAVEGRDGLLETLEEGGTRSAREPMAVPLARRFQGGRNRSKWEAALKSGEFDVIPSRGLLVQTRVGGRVGGSRAGFRSEIVGMLRRKTTVRPLLGFFARWEKILPRVQARYDSDVEKMLTAAGRAGLEARVATNANAAKASAAASKDYLKSNPADAKGSRKAAREAARLVRANALDKGGRS